MPAQLHLTATTTGQDHRQIGQRMIIAADAQPQRISELSNNVPEPSGSVFIFSTIATAPCATC